MFYSELRIQKFKQDLSTSRIRLFVSDIVFGVDTRYDWFGLVWESCLLLSISNISPDKMSRLGEDIDNSFILCCCLLSAIWLSGKTKSAQPLENLQYLVFSAIGNNNWQGRKLKESNFIDGINPLKKMAIWYNKVFRLN